MALPRALIRVLAFAAVTLGVVLLYNLAFTPSPEGVWDASSWADRRSKNSPFTTEDNPNGVVYDIPVHDTAGSKWNIFGGSGSGSVKKEKAPKPNTSTPRPLPRVNTTRARENFGTSRIVIPNTSPEEYKTAPLPSLDQAFAHLEPMLRAVKEKHQHIPREHDLWQPIFPPFLTDELQERFWHLREDWDEATQTWKHTGDKRFMLVTVCKQVAGEFLSIPSMDYADN
jgi:alpha-1,3-mannosyltransferase